MTALQRAGFAAHRRGVKWWNNPHRAGSPAAYQWDQGHTLARRDAEQAALDALEAADLAPEPGEVITEALRPYLGAALAENHADDVLDALTRAGFQITRKEA